MRPFGPFAGQWERRDATYTTVLSPREEEEEEGRSPGVTHSLKH
jgi:hypothetical protein